MLYDFLSIFHAYFKVDILIVLGFSGVFAFPFKRIFGKKIIFNLGGIEWQKVRGKKLLSKIEVSMKKWFERITIRCADEVVVDNRVLWDYVLEEYNITSNLIEYGGDHVKTNIKTEELITKYHFLNKQYDVTVSRAQEDMNIHIVIEAYQQSPNRTVVIISNWEISDYGIKLKKEHQGKHPNIILLDAIYDLYELNAIRGNASLYLHTHSLCGTAPSLVEAMYLGLPVVCYDVETNRATTENKSYYFTDNLTLIDVLSKIDKQLMLKLGNEMKKIAERRYTWERIVSLYKKLMD